MGPVLASSLPECRVVDDLGRRLVELGQLGIGPRLGNRPSGDRLLKLGRERRARRRDDVSACLAFRRSDLRQTLTRLQVGHYFRRG